MKSLKELYDFLGLDQQVTYEEFCFGYKVRYHYLHYLLIKWEIVKRLCCSTQ